MYRNAVKERFVSSGAESGPALPVQFVVGDDFVALFCHQQHICCRVQVFSKVNFILKLVGVDK